MDPKKITLDGRDFHMNPLKPRQVLRISKNLVQLLGAGFKQGNKVQVMTAIANGLNSMEDDQFEEFCILIMSTTQAAAPSGAIDINSADNFDAAFTGIKIENVLVLIYEIMRYNQFPLLRDLDLDIGELMEEMQLSVREELNKEDKEQPTENQESSQKS